LKKRSKKLLSVKDGTETSGSNATRTAMDESFLLLFFKKEALYLLSAAWFWWAEAHPTVF
jgi:hypothetical protein